MAQEFTDDAKNLMLDVLDAGANAIWLSAHTATPGLTGANEVSGGTPAYARIEATYAAASGGSKALSSSVTLDIPASTTVAFVGAWTAVTAGTFLGQVDTTDEVFGSQGTLEITTATLALDQDPA
jgi:hypothetical protein